VASDETDHVVALWRLQSSYADVVNRRAWSELADLFRPDAVVHLDSVTASPQEFVGPEGVGSFIGTAIERFDHFSFVILNTVIDVTGADTATGRIFMCEIRHAAAEDDWTFAYGLYQDQYVHVDKRWWFGARSYRSLARTGPQAGVFGLASGLEPFGR
jgi:hypothetical protein